MTNASPVLTYCGNVHPAEDLHGWLTVLEGFSAGLWKSRRPRPFPLGVWWNAATVETLVGDAEARATVAEALARHGLTVGTLNVFPFGSFHGERVKEAVYQPDWSREERVHYTRGAAEVAAGLLPRGTLLPISTLPLGHGSGDLRRMARNLVRSASAFRDLEERTGVRVLLCLEPEPLCLLETVAGTVAFLEEWVFREGAWATVEEATLRRHLGVCVDLCHLAVVGEDPLVAARRCAESGVAVGKIQVSACLELRDPEALDLLLAYDEPRYLHQTVAAGGARALDLGEVRARAAEFRRGGTLRTHFHVPIFWDAAGPLGSTRAELERALVGWPRPLPLLEVETYTWGVLQGQGRAAPDLAAGIEAELEFLRQLV